jgi:hypothetical protein
VVLGISALWKWGLGSNIFGNLVMRITTYYVCELRTMIALK